MSNTFAIYASAIGLCVGLSCSSAKSDELFQLNAQERGQAAPSYPTPQAYPAPHAIQDKYTAVTPTLSSSVRTQVVLPPPFLGVWNVRGQRMKIEAAPAFQESAQNAFSPVTSNVWEITGDPSNGYSLGSNTGVKTRLVVDKVQGNQAYIRYAHPIGNTVAQEAIVMQLGPQGLSFTGLERVSIVKTPQEPPRAKVTYQLNGTKQP